VRIENEDHVGHIMRKAGTYLVFLKVSYRDNLRIPHELTINGSVDYEPVQQTNNEGQSIFGIGSNSNVGRNTPAMKQMTRSLYLVNTITDLMFQNPK
jgi:hypothetical protein